MRMLCHHPTISMGSRTALRGITVSSLISLSTLHAQIVAFPEAEGFGRFATGGRGGRVIEVTNLNDTGPGSLRSAIVGSDPRTVVFCVSGTIKLFSSLTIRDGNLTIAGQTAPGDGICVRDNAVLIEADNVIIRYLRFRMGDATRIVGDALSGSATSRWMFKNIIIDHCSISWGIDECSSFYKVSDFTMQWCFITESLNHSHHTKGDHGYGGIWGGRRASFHHNLLAHHTSRTPRFNGGRYGEPSDSELVDFRNNVIYNWGFNSAYGGEEGNQNVVANYYKYGPGTKVDVRTRILDPSDAIGNWFVADNVVFGNAGISSDNWDGGVQGEFAEAQRHRRRLTPFPYGAVTTHTPAEALDLVLAEGGASLPQRDIVDARIVHEVRMGTATFGGSWGLGTGIIDSQDSVGAWPALVSSPPPLDSDHDGIPDAWELQHGLNPRNAADGATMRSDGYSNLESYMNSLVSEHAQSSGAK